jgi:glycosyltransferase involved in cell wall biosynthesis
LISIILPCLNANPFLQKRIQSIQRQSLIDWEVIALDGFSEDGSWELLRTWAQQDPRVRATQLPRQGIYQALNAGIALAQGDFIYIATADDTMEPRCLEVLQRALADHPRCDVAQCGLTVIDELGQSVTDENLSWEKQPLNQFYFGEWLQKKHVRPAPHDGILHAATGTVFTSLTQLLLRRSVFARAGLFRSDWGGAGDYEWGMRVGLLHDTIFIPEHLATWRRHSSQLTDDSNNNTATKRRQFVEMQGEALQHAFKMIPALKKILRVKKLSRPFRHQAWIFERRYEKNPRSCWQQWVTEPDLINLDLTFCRKGHFVRCHVAWIKQEIKRLGLAHFQEIA